MNIVYNLPFFVHYIIADTADILKVTVSPLIRFIIYAIITLGLFTCVGPRRIPIVGLYLIA